MTLDARIYPDPVDRQLRLEGLAGRVAATPGIEEAGIAENVPFGSDDLITVLRSGAVPDVEIEGERRAISPDVLTLLGMPLVRGRGFSESDDRGSTRVAIVNETLARRLGGNVLGASIQVGRAPTAPFHEIVGVVRDARSSGVTARIHNEVYVPARQAPGDAGYLVMRSSLDLNSLTRIVQRELRVVAPASPLRPARSAVSLEEEMSQALARPRFLAFLSAGFSTTALLLSALGVFGVVACTVAQRKQELGIRSALGAGPHTLIARTLASALVPCGIGIVLGAGVAAYATRFIAAELHGVTTLDAPTFVAASGVLAIACLTAAALPARRAARLDLMEVLRRD